MPIIIYQCYVYRTNIRHIPPEVAWECDMFFFFFFLYDECDTMSVMSVIRCKFDGGGMLKFVFCEKKNFNIFFLIVKKNFNLFFEIFFFEIFVYWILFSIFFEICIYFVATTRHTEHCALLVAFDNSSRR